MVYIKAPRDLHRTILTSSFQYHFPEQELYFFEDDEGPAEILAKCKEKWPDTLVLDCQQTDYNELVKALYDNYIIIPTVCLVRQSDDKLKQDLLHSGVSDLLHIPYTDEWFTYIMNRNIYPDPPRT